MGNRPVVDTFAPAPYTASVVEHEMTFGAMPSRRGSNPLSGLDAAHQGLRERKTAIRRVVYLSALALAIAMAGILMQMEGAPSGQEAPAQFDVLTPARPITPGEKMRLLGVEEAPPAPVAAAPGPEGDVEDRAAPAAPPPAAPPVAGEEGEPSDLPTIEELKREYVFRGVVDPTARLEELDAEVLFAVMDVGRDPRNPTKRVLWGADKIEYDVAAHIFTWLRGQAPGALARRARAEAGEINPATGRPWGPVPYGNLIRWPEPYRGRVVRFRGSVVKVADIVQMPEKGNPSGVRDTTLIFARSIRGNLHVFLLPIPPHELMPLVSLKTQVIEIDGIFMKDYRVEKRDGKKRLMPLVLALGYRRVEIETPSPWVALGVVAAAVVFGAFIFFVTMREMRASRARRRALAHRRLARNAGPGVTAPSAPARPSEAPPSPDSSVEAGAPPPDVPPPPPPPDGG